jgi:hypothetical protein
MNNIDKAVKDLEKMYKIAKELRTMDIPILQGNIARIIGSLRELLVALAPHKNIEHPVDYE